MLAAAVAAVALAAAPTPFAASVSPVRWADIRHSYRAGCPVAPADLRTVRLTYRGSDDASMAADNTSAFNCRRAVGSATGSWSMHAYGLAVDVNPRENPYLLG